MTRSRGVITAFRAGRCLLRAAECRQSAVSAAFLDCSTTASLWMKSEALQQPDRRPQDARDLSNVHASTSARTFFSLGSPVPSKVFNQRRLVGWSPEHMYTVVSRVEDYHKFVPWCQKSTIIKPPANNYMEAELEVGFQVLVERYTSQVFLAPPRSVRSRVPDSSLFDHLDSTWTMEPGPTPRSCWLSFSVDFAFRSPLHGYLADLFFSEVVKQMTGAFEGRCATLYGPSSLLAAPLGGGGGGGTRPGGHVHGHGQAAATAGGTAAGSATRPGGGAGAGAASGGQVGAAAGGGPGGWGQRQGHGHGRCQGHGHWQGQHVHPQRQGGSGSGVGGGIAPAGGPQQQSQQPQGGEATSRTAVSGSGEVRPSGSSEGAAGGGGGGPLPRSGR